MRPDPNVTPNSVLRKKVKPEAKEDKNESNKAVKKAKSSK
jgi:hypothetical protein